MVNLVTVPGVELMRTGKWALSTGEWECTPEVIAAAVAAHDAQVLRKPVIRLGHNDPRFSGDPAVGWIDNLRTADDGNTLVGDMVGVPEWLADIMPSAYPSRSVEGMHSYTAPDGSEHGFVLTGLALLGATKPGVESLKSLQDVAQLYDVAAARQIGGTAIEFVLAAADAKKPYGDVDYADPGYQADGVHRYPLDSRAHVKAAWDLISMGGHADPYSSQQLTHIKRRIREAAAKFGITTAAAAADERADMPLSKEVAARLGVGEDATEADVLAAIGRIEAAAPKPKSGNAAEDGEDDEDDDEESGDRKPGAKGAGGPNPAAGGGKKVAAASGTTVTLHTDKYEELVQAAEAGRKAFERQQSDDAAKVVDAAIAAGKITPARRGDYVAAMELDREGTTQILASLAPGLVPLAPIGHALSDESSPEALELNDIHNRVMASFGIPTAKKAGN